MSEVAPDESNEPAVQDHEFLLRRFQNQPAEYDDGAMFPTYSAFIPGAIDTDGLSVNREGENYPTAFDVKAASGSANIRLYGGVVAVLCGAIRSLEMTVIPTKGDLPGHAIIPELNRVAYEERNPATRERIGRQAAQRLADKIIRLAKTNPGSIVVRIHPAGPSVRGKRG